MKTAKNLKFTERILTVSKLKLTKLEKNWIKYDVGNSAYILLATTIIPILFKSIGENSLSSSDYLASWGYSMTISTLVIAILSPILGAISDGRGKRKPMFQIFLFIGIIGLIIQPLTTNWIVFLAIFIITKIGFNGSLVFYDSMLPDITTNDRMDEVSSFGYAWGYIGSCVPFILSIVLATKGGDLFGLSLSTSMIIICALNAAWWLFFSMPLIKTYEQKYYIENQNTTPKVVFKRLLKTVKEIGENKKIRYFLLSFFFYIDGVYTIIGMATAYGESLGLDSAGLILALLATQIVAFPCAIYFGRISKKYKTETLLKITIVAYGLITLYATFLNNLTQFWILAILVGMFQGAIQALSRSYFAKIIPPEKSGEYFGVFDIFGKGASIFGTLLIAVVTDITEKQQYGIMALVALFIIGYFVFDRAVKVKA